MSQVNLARHGSRTLCRPTIASVRSSLLGAALLALMLIGAIFPAQAQSLLPEAPAAQSAPADAYGRDSPRGLARGLLRALSARDYNRASEYFDLSQIPAEARERIGPERARLLIGALNAGGSVTAPPELSSDPLGRIDDELPANEERIGTLPGGGNGAADIPLLASSTSRDGQTIWLVSSDSLARLSTLALTDEPSLRDRFPRILRETMVAGAPLADWLILLGAAALFYALVRGACYLLLLVFQRIRTLDEKGLACRLLRMAPAPLSLWLSMLLFLGTVPTLGVTFIARQLASQVGGAIAFVGFAWFIWRMIDLGAELLAENMQHRHRLRARSIIIFMRRALKIVLVMVAGVQALTMLGVDVTTAIAALGIGGLAIALGAQKTVENVVGSVSVVVDEPVRVGDLCRVDEFEGTVEEIGIRSTRLRTTERTRITIPNSTFSSSVVENLSARDRYLFAPILRLNYDLEADDIERALEAIRSALADADYLHEEGARANLKAFGEMAIEIEVYCWIEAEDSNAAIVLQEKLLLEILRRITGTGASLAAPAALPPQMYPPDEEEPVKPKKRASGRRA